jgi:hypothetical protein
MGAALDRVVHHLARVADPSLKIPACPYGARLGIVRDATQVHHRLSPARRAVGHDVTTKLVVGYRLTYRIF